MTVNGEYFWIVLDGDNVLFIGDSESDAKNVANQFEYAEAVQCCRCG